jgi:Spy/CpxP family protein refolding chaperone
MKKVSAVFLGLVALSLWTAPVFAQHHLRMGPPGPGGMMMGDGPGMMLPLMLKKLELTAEQDTQVQNIMAAHRDAFKTLFTKLEAAHEEMANKFFAPGELNTADLTSQTQGMSQLREQLMNEGLKVALEIRGVLTPEQIAKAAQLKDQMQALHAEMRSLFEDK